MRYLSLFASTILLAALSFGQGANGTITGAVTDATGASVANASIEVSNKANGQLFSAQTTPTGNYTVPQLPVGTYDLKVSVPGFKAYSRNGLVLAAAQTMRIDVPLEVGAVSDSVVITADASLLVTETAATAHNVTLSQLNNLPILVSGGAGNNNTSGYKDPFALASLLPGVQYNANNAMVVDGTPNNTIQIRVEGQTSGNTGTLRQYTAIGQPSSDAIQEVAVQTSNYAAEFGAVGGAVFNATMKSGTNQFHGSANDYAANEALNAHQPYTGLRSPTKRHDYDITFGGPVWIPKLYNGSNKTFFFGGLEKFYENVKVSNVNPVPTVPIDAYRNGDFNQVIIGNGIAGVGRPLQVGGVNYVDPLGRPVISGQIFDSTTEKTVTVNGITSQVRDAFNNNQIPVTRFDPVAVKILALVPKPIGPNAASGQIGNNFQNPWIGQTRSMIPSLKLDQVVGSKQRFSFYYGNTSQQVQYSSPNGNMEGLPVPITGARGSFIYTYTYRVNYDYTLSPTLLLHLGAGWYHENFDDSAPVTDYNALTQLGLKGATLNRNFPQIIVGSTGLTTGGMNNLGPFTQGTGGSERRPSGIANMTWVKGNHTYKIGGEWRGERYPTTAYTNTPGTYNFNSPTGTNSTVQTALATSTISIGSTGFPFASFLLGELSQVTIAQPAVTSVGKQQAGLFIQDTWKFTRKLTLDYGLRWDYGQYAHEQYGRAASFNPLLPNASAGGHPGGNQFEATCNCHFASNYPYAIGPRIGAAYQINSKTVIRGGIGIVYAATTNSSGVISNSIVTGTPGYGQIVGLLKDGIPSNLVPVFPNFAPNVGQNPGTVVSTTYLDPNAGRPARQYQWSLGVQREINKDLVVEASYIGNRGMWWSGANIGQAVAESALNATTVQDLARYGFTVGNAADSTLLRTQLGQLNAGQQSILASRGVFLPYSNYPSSQTVRQSLLPFPQYGGTLISPAQAPVGNTWYDSLQTNLTKRFSHGLSMNANYTYSKNLDLFAPADIFNRSLGKSISVNDLPHQFRLSAQYELPNFRKSHMAMLSNKFVASVISGWGAGVLLQYQSAARLNRPLSSGANPISNWLGRGPGSPNNGAAQQALDANGKPINPWSIDWTDLSGVHHTDPLDVNCHCYDPTKTQVLNPAAWVNIPDGQWANDFSAIRSFRGLRYPNENVNLSRNFRIRERVNFNIRIEFQNAFNRLRLPQPIVAANFAATPIKTANGLYSSGFGTIVPISGTTGARTGLLIGRLTF